MRNMLQMRIINYFISSNMIDILFLSSENNRGKGNEKENLPKEERFNQIFAKLRQRNVHNDCIIKKYVKKMGKRKGKFPQDTEIIQNYTEEQHDQQPYPDDQDPAGEEQDPRQGQKEKLVRSDNLLKATNHTLTQQPIQLTRKVQTLPVIDYSSTNNIKNEQQSKTNSKQTLQPFKYDKQFNKYLRNVFFKEIAVKAEPTKVMAELKNQAAPLRTSQNRIKTQTSSYKYQLSIKSLIFGNQEVSPQKKRDQNQSKNKRIFDQVSRHVSKHQKDDIFRDDNFSTKGMLPLIQSQGYNKRCAQSEIRKTNDKIKEGKDIKGIKLPNYADPCGQNESGNRIGLSFRIHTIQIKQHF